MSRNRSWYQGMIAVLLAAGLLLAAGTVRADTVPVSSGYWSGSRTASATNTEMVVTGNWAEAPWVKLSWNITLKDGVFTYVYTASRTGSHAISHFDIEVSAGFGSSDVLNASSIGKIEFSDPSWTDLAKALGKQPGAVLKFEHGATESDGVWTATYTLVTRRIPIWGDFLMKDGNGTLSYNPGFGTDPTSATTVFTNWIPTPDTAYVVPLPAAAWAGLALLGTLSLTRRRRTRA